MNWQKLRNKLRGGGRKEKHNLYQQQQQKKKKSGRNIKEQTMNKKKEVKTFRDKNHIVAHIRQKRYRIFLMDSTTEINPIPE